VSEARSETRYVVLHNGVGLWSRGDVVKASVLGDAENVARLAGLGAVREANPAEAKCEHVHLQDKAAVRPASYEATLAEKDRTIEQLKGELRATQEQLQVARLRPPEVDPVKTRAVQDLLAEKDRTIRALEQQLQQPAGSEPGTGAEPPTPPAPPEEKEKGKSRR